MEIEARWLLMPDPKLHSGVDGIDESRTWYPGTDSPKVGQMARQDLK